MIRGRGAHRFAESPVLKLALPAWRSRLVGLLLLGAFGVLVGRSFYLQIINNDFLQEKGESRYRRDLEISASRGKVTDRNGDVLAISTPMKSVWAIPSDARLTGSQQQQLAKLLDMDVKELSRRLASDKGFAWLQRQVGSLNFVLRTLLFVLLCAVGYGMLIVHATPWLAKGLAQLNNYTLAPALVLVFVAIGVIAERR